MKLRVMGLSYSPLQNGAFALLLAVDGDSPVRIPVVIGPAEAQSIAIRLEGVRSPRPMTHDLFYSFAQAFGVRLVEVFIYKFEDGIYSSEMTFTDGERQIVLDSRTSDAIAIAMRSGAPIYTTEAIVEETGIELEEVETSSDGDGDDSTVEHIMKQAEPAEMSVDELEQKLAKLIEDENYEEASRISELLKFLREKESDAGDDNKQI